MTVSTETSSNRFVATGGQTVFPYGFRILDKTHIDVFQNGTLLTITTNYTVTGVGDAGGGNVTLLVGATANDLLTILRDTPFTQNTDYVENDAFPANTHEDALDQLTMANQQQEERIDRSLRFDVDSTDSTVVDAPVVGQFLRHKAAGGIDSATLALTGTATSVDETDTDTVKDKLTSNALAKRAEDTALAVNGVQVGSAVNQLQVTNSISSNPILIEATGTATDLDINITPKGTGTVVIDKDLDVDNINIDGNTISSTDTAGDIIVTPDTTGDLVLDGVNWPQADGTVDQMLSTDGAAQTSWVTFSSITRETAQATTSGTEFDFTSLPASIQRVKVIFDRVSLSGGTDSIIVQLGDSVGFETSGYLSDSGSFNNSTTQTTKASTSGFVLVHDDGTDSLAGIMTIERIQNNDWVAAHSFTQGNGGFVTCGAGTKTVSDELTQVRITRDGSTDTFDAGAVTITYER